MFFRAWGQHLSGVRHGPAQRVGLDLGGSLHASPVQHQGLHPPTVEVGAPILLPKETGSSSQEERQCQAAQRGRACGDGDDYLKADSGQWVRTAESTASFRSGVNCLY